MGGRFGDARAIAHEFIEAMQPNDLIDLIFFDDVQVVNDSQVEDVQASAPTSANALNEFKSTMPSHGSDRALFTQIKKMTQDAFGALGNSRRARPGAAAPGDGACSRTAPAAAIPRARRPARTSSTSTSTTGRFPQDNTSLPKTPLPVISIWFPNPSSLIENIYRNNEAQFMQSLANPEIGGFFDIVKEGEGAAKGKTIIGLVRARFNAMWIVHWELSLHQPQRRADVQPRLREHEADHRARTGRSRTCRSASIRRSGRSTST